MLTLQVFVAAAVPARILLAPRCYTEVQIADCRVWQLASRHLALVQYALWCSHLNTSMLLPATLLALA